MGQVPRGTSSSEKWEEEEETAKENGKVREVRGDSKGRESQSRDREGSVSYATGGQGVGNPTGLLHQAVGRSLCPSSAQSLGVTVTGQWKGKGGPSRR